MIERHRARHIRDIAHLYLSTLPKKEESPPLVVAAAPGRHCFLAMHAANLAAALAVRTASAVSAPRVRIIDLGGALPNTGYYLALPPGDYLRVEGGCRDGSVTGVLGIELCFSLEAAVERRRPRSAGAVDVMVLPSLERSGFAEELLYRAREHAGGETALLYCCMHQREYEPLRDLISTSGWEHSVYLLSLSRSVAASSPEEGIASVGIIEGWRERLRRRVPAVLDRPGCLAAASYVAACESLLFKIARRRRHVLGTASGREKVDSETR